MMMKNSLIQIHPHSGEEPLIPMNFLRLSNGFPLPIIESINRNPQSHTSLLREILWFWDVKIPGFLFFAPDFQWWVLYSCSIDQANRKNHLYTFWGLIDLLLIGFWISGQIHLGATNNIKILLYTEPIYWSLTIHVIKYMISWI